MSTLKEVCKCSHHKDTHFAERPSTGDVTKPAESGRIVYGACLGSCCDCQGYELLDEAA